MASHANSSAPWKRFTSKGSANASWGSEPHHCSFTRCKGKLRYGNATGLSEALLAVNPLLSEASGKHKQLEACCVHLTHVQNSSQPSSCPSLPNIQPSLIPPGDDPPACTPASTRCQKCHFSVLSCYSQEFAHQDMSLWLDQLIPLSRTALQRLHKATDFSKHGSSYLERH